MDALNVSQGCIQPTDCSLRIEAFHLIPIITNDTTRSVMETPNLGRYRVSLEVVPPPSKISNRGTYSLQCD